MTSPSPCRSGSPQQPQAAVAATDYVTIPSLEVRFTVGPEIGRGAYSTVRQVTDRETGEVFVAKICSVQDPGAFNPEESDILLSAQHENLVRCVGVYQSPTHCALVMEDLRKGGDLFSLINSAPGSRLAEASVRELMRGLLKALRYLHDELGVVHRDVKLENIMLGDRCEVNGSSPWSPICVSGNVKLIDFGFSKRIGRSRSLSSCCGSPNYMSPEVLRSSRTQDQSTAYLPTRHQPYGNEVDVWAAGVVMYVLLVGKYPFYHERKSLWHKSILLGQYQVPSTSNVSELAKDLLAKLLTVRADDRLSAAEALHHPWLFDENAENAEEARMLVAASECTPGRRKPSAAATPFFTPPHNVHFESPSPNGLGSAKPAQRVEFPDGQATAKHR